MSHRLGVDVGGTFTDLVLVSPDGVARTRKVLSTTANYAEAIVIGVRELASQAGIAARDIGEIIHGTTVATNAILERRGARAGLLTTEGFRDLLEIGRLRLLRLYDLDFERPAPLVPRRWRREIRERMNHRGEVVTPLDRDGAAAAIDRLLAEGVESIAVCFLHAYANPAHEAQVGAMIRERAPHVALTLSSEILERTSTAVTNAYVMPVMGRYLASLEGELRALEARAPLLIMQSNGGVMTAEGGRQRPVHVIESGPAAGVIATAALARAIGAPNALSIDMGGTTAKASIIEGYEIKRTGEFEIGGSMSQGSRLNKGGGFLLRVPAIDIAEVGAGGGSIVHVDGARALHVGPRSAGAVPGPVCYDQGGTEVTLTDANVTLGYLHPERLPSGLRLDAQKARRAVAEQIAAPLGIDVAASRWWPSAATARSSPPRWRARSRSARSWSRPRPASSAPWACWRPRWSITWSGRSSGRSSARSPRRSAPWWRRWSARPRPCCAPRAAGLAWRSSGRWTSSTRGNPSSSRCRCRRRSATRRSGRWPATSAASTSAPTATRRRAIPSRS